MLILVYLIKLHILVDKRVEVVGDVLFLSDFLYQVVRFGDHFTATASTTLQ